MKVFKSVGVSAICLTLLASSGFAQSPTISTIAGNGGQGYSGDGGPATAARLLFPGAVAVDGSGNLFIADSGGYRVRKVTPAGIITTVAGTGISGFSGDGGPATAAQLAGPFRVAVDGSGNLFIADLDANFNGRIRKVTAAGIISTVAGNGTSGFSGDGGQATAAQLWHPCGITVDGSGNLFIAEGWGSAFAVRDHSRIRKVTPAGIISTVAGVGTYGFSGDGGPATSAQLAEPADVIVDASGNLFIADSNNGRIRKVTAAGIISTVAGNGCPETNTSCVLGDGGPATSAQLKYPVGVAVDGFGNIFIADRDDSRVRKVTPAGIITTYAGNGTSGFSGDGGPAAAAQLSNLTDLAADVSGNIFIADDSNNRVRKVSTASSVTTPAVITGISAVSGAQGATVSATIAGTNLGGATAVTFSGSGVTAAIGITGTSTALPFLITIAGTAAAGTRTVTVTTPAGTSNSFSGFTVTNTFSFSSPVNGGMSATSLGGSSATTVGYARIQPSSGNSTPSGLAIFGFRENGVLVTEAGVPASPLIQSGRIYAEVNGPVNTGLAIANPNSQPATISFFFTGANGDFGSGTTTIPANGQTASFLNQPPFSGPASLSGSFTFNSSVPISVIAIRGYTNERSEFLITTLPVADLAAAPASGAILFPHFADGGGWTTQIVLVNPTDNVLSGIVQFRDQSGQFTNVNINGQTDNSFSYSIAARSSQKLQTSGAGASPLVGTVQAIGAGNGTAPAGLVIFSFHSNGVTVAEAGVPVSPPANAFRIYAEASGDFSHSASGSIQTGVAITNSSNSMAIVTLALYKLDGSSTGLSGTLQIPANGQVSTFLNQIQGFASLQTPFQGVLRVSSPSTIAMVGLRGRYNERNDFLFTTTPPVNEGAAAPASTLFFPHIVDGGGYTTQFIIFSGQAGQTSSGTLQLFSQSGAALTLSLAP